MRGSFHTNARRIVRLLWAGAILALARPAGAQYLVNGAERYQVMDGFGANINHRSWNGDELKPVLDAMIDEGGMTIFRVLFDNTDWMPSEDCSDARLAAIYGSARFDSLWDVIGYLNQKGITNQVMLGFCGSGPDWMGGQMMAPGKETAWARMVASLVAYARNTKHLQFGLLGPDNEPNLSSYYCGIWAKPTQYTTMLDQLARELDSNGVEDVRLVAPETACGGTAYLPEMLADARVMSKVAHVGVHSYQPNGLGSTGITNYLAASAYRSLNFWMTEFNYWCFDCTTGVHGSYDWTFARGTAQYLLNFIANGASAGLAWEGCDSYYELMPLANLNTAKTGYQGAGWSLYGLFGVDDTNAAVKTYTARKNFYTLEQITRFVPPGSRRIGVNGPQSQPFTMLAFYDAASGRVTLAGCNTGVQTRVPIALQSLPAVASFDLYYTDANTNLNHSATFPVSGGSFTPVIPADCVFTLTGFDPARIAVAVRLGDPTNGAYYTAPAAVFLHAAAKTTTGTITGVEFYANGGDLGWSATAPYTLAWDGVRPGKYSVTAAAFDSAGNSNVSPAINITVAGPAARMVVTPANVLVIPHGRQLFAASVVDVKGTPLAPQPAVTWSVDGGGSIDSNGLFVAGPDIGGPFNIMAANEGVSTRATVSIAGDVNVATKGIGYVWYNLPSKTSNTQQYESPGINDGDVEASVPLLPCCEGPADFVNNYEAAGVVWSSPQNISRVVFINGVVSGGNGSFDSDFQLQFTDDGCTWKAAGPEWKLLPSYSYNSPSATLVPYTFSGEPAPVRGVRCVGRVNTGRSTSGVACATEVQAFLGIPTDP